MIVIRLLLAHRAPESNMEGTVSDYSTWSTESLLREAQEDDNSAMNDRFSADREAARSVLRNRGVDVDFSQWPYDKTHHSGPND